MLLLRVSKGMGMLEVLVAMFLATVAVMATLSLQAPSLRTAARSDYFGRAAEIMERQLESTEVYIMDRCNTLANANTGIPVLPAIGASTNAVYSVTTSGLGAAINGDTTYTVSTTITGVAIDYFRVDVKVTWNINATGISQTIFVSRQYFFKIDGEC